MVRFGLLGPLLVTDVAGRGAALPAAKQRIVLAGLLLSANTAVSTDRMIEILWGASPPPNAAAVVRNYVMRLRRQVGPAGGRIVTRPGGYAVVVREPAEFDLAQAESLQRAARSAAQAGRWPEASALLSQALSLWRGEPFVDIPSPELARLKAPHLAELKLHLAEERIDADLRLARHDELVAELRLLVAEHPLREHLRAQLMAALHGCGRQAEALEMYRDIRATLSDELGLEPGPELQQLHQRILIGDPGPSAAAPRRVASHLPATAQITEKRRVVPRQLPAATRRFTGRAAERAALDTLLDQAAEDAGTVVISAIGGMAGVGKTALAVHWAHQVADKFPDGQLYVNLRGYDKNEPLSAQHVLAAFLRALGVDGRDIPADEQERAAHFRSLLAGRRILVVLDNVSDSEQARPLLPGTAGCMTIVTSRDTLAGLVARNGAERIQLDTLPAPDALALLRALLGGRVDAEPDAAAALVDLCGCLPLALRVAAELVTARPETGLAGLAAELADQRRRLELLDAGRDGGTAVRSVFSWSYQHLNPGIARAFRFVGLHPGPDLEPHAAAALTGSTPEQARRLLAELARAHLVHAISANRYGMHDLLRVYAREQASADDDAARHAAMTALLDYYVHTAAAAMNSVYPSERSRRPASWPSAGLLAPLGSAAAAQRWLDAERANLIAAAEHAADHGWPAHATQLSATTERYFSFGYHLTEARILHSHALRAARDLSDRAAEATALTHLGTAERLRNRFQQAASYHRQASDLFEAARNRAGQARALHRLAICERQLGELPQAIEHATQSLLLCQQDGDRLGQARAQQNLGITKRVQGCLPAAADDQRRALPVFDELADQLGQSVTIRELGIIELRLGRLGPAAEYIRQAQTLYRQTGNPSGEACVLSLLGLICLRRGHQQQAASYQERALAAYRAVCDLEGEGEALARLALTELGAGRSGQAIRHLELALSLARKLGTLPLENSVLNGLGEAALAAARADQARMWFAAALQLAGRTGNTGQRDRAHQGLAQAHADLGHASQAEQHRGQATGQHAWLGT